MLCSCYIVVWARSWYKLAFPNFRLCLHLVMMSRSKSPRGCPSLRPVTPCPCRWKPCCQRGMFRWTQWHYCCYCCCYYYHSLSLYIVLIVVIIIILYLWKNIRHLPWNWGVCMALFSYHLLNISGSVYSVHRFMWFLWLSWRKSTFHAITTLDYFKM